MTGLCDDSAISRADSITACSAWPPCSFWNSFTFWDSSASNSRRRLRETTGNDYRIFGPVEVMKNLNTAMSDQNLAGCLFATCCYGLLNVRTLQLTFARAGHPYPVLIRKGEGPVQLENRGGLLGVFEHTEFEQQTVQLAVGDKVFLYSDGCEPLVGKAEDDGGFMFTPDFSSLADLPIEEMLGQFHEMVQKHNVPAAEVDDVTAIGFEIL